MVVDINKLKRDFNKKKRDFIKSKLSNDNIYDYLNPQQKEVIKKYYENYTVLLFNRMRGSLRLNVPKSKVKSLAILKGEGDWDFAGMVDFRVRGAETCELGHPLRYCYFAKNAQNGNILKFGSTCVGDFFDLSKDDVKVLTNIKNVMLKEIKEMVAIKENNWFDEYTLLDADIIGRIWRYMGQDSLERVQGISIKNLMLSFIQSGLPLPQTLISEILRGKGEIEQNINEFIMFKDSNPINNIYNCGIPFISEMYKLGFTNIVDKVRSEKITDTPNNIQMINRYFGFKNKEELLNNLNLWGERAERLNKAFDYFKKLGIITPWVELFNTVIKDKDVSNEVYLAVNLLAAFDLNSDISRVYNVSDNIFPYKSTGVEIQKNLLDNFDKIVDDLAKRSTIEYILLLEKKIKEEKAVEQQKRDREVQVIEYIINNIDGVKYQGIWGKEAIKDILINKGLTFENMTEKQANFVQRYYTEMNGIDLREKNKSQVHRNKSYLLKDKPDVIGKIQRLQNEAEDSIPQKTKDIMISVLRYKRVTDRQLNHINNAYLTYVIGEKVENTEKEPEEQCRVEVNRKYKLKERPDIEEKLIEIQNSVKYESLPIKTKDIISSVLKYKSVSDRQLVYIESAYEKVRV